MKNWYDGTDFRHYDTNRIVITLDDIESQLCEFFDTETEGLDEEEFQTVVEKVAEHLTFGLTEYIENALIDTGYAE